jgi:serine/threonine protein kinase
MDTLLRPGALFGSYRVTRILGSGRSGATYLAMTPAGAPVVLRVFPRPGSPEAARALVKEQEQLEDVRHPYVARVLDAGLEGESFYVVRDFVPGQSLAEQLGWPPQRMAYLLASVTDAVRAVHAAGLVHGSLRPENVLVASGEVPVLVDFGALASTDPVVPQTFTSPEVLRGDRPTPAADVYALGAIARWALPSRRRYTAQVWNRALERDPLGRPSLDDVRASLLEEAAPPPPMGPQAVPPPPPTEPEGRPAGSDAADTHEEPPRSPRAVVNTGFERPERPGRRLSRRTPLVPDTPYLFTLDVGPKDPDSIERTPVPLPSDRLPRGARLTVTVHPVQGDVAMSRAARIGTLMLRDDGSAEAVNAEDNRLRFPFRTGKEGTIGLRVSILLGATLVQSRLVTAQVARPGVLMRGSVRQRAELDYTLVTDLAVATMEPLANAADVSLMLNGDGETHALQVVARDEASGRLFTRGATYDAAALQDAVGHARAVLRMVAWGTEAPWKDGEPYRYGGPPNPDRLRIDLIRLAIKGYRLYDACVNELAGGPGEAFDAFEQLMRPPRRVQLASRRDPRLLLPISLFYDAPLDTSGPIDDFTICDAYSTSSVAGSACLQEGRCPHYCDDTVVCPSGFWGFRHIIGLPVSLRPGAAKTVVQAATEIRFKGTPSLAMAVSTDPLFTMRAGHELQVKALVDEAHWRYADSLDDTIKMLRASGNQLIYFYCHGGVAGGTPYLQVGGTTERGMTSDMVRAKRIRWREPSRPLVFINGCHTTALEPEQLFNFVSALVENASAAGVVGTEITNFEPLAGSFATVCLEGR